MIPICWLSGHFRYSLIATGHQRIEFYGTAIASVTTAVLCVLLVPAFQSLGGALALVAGGLANAIVTAVAVQRRVGELRIGAAIAAPVAACAVFVLGGRVLSAITGEVLASIIAFGPYVWIALKRDSELVRLRQAWLGR
jgi:O-antigen/teichoic acid export membrane protein